MSVFSIWKLSFLLLSAKLSNGLLDLDLKANVLGIPIKLKLGAESKEKEIGPNVPLLANPLGLGLPLGQLPLSPLEQLGQIAAKNGIPIDQLLTGQKPLSPGELPLGVNNGLPIQKPSGLGLAQIVPPQPGVPGGKTSLTFTDGTGPGGNLNGAGKPSSRPEQTVQPGGIPGGGQQQGKIAGRAGNAGRTGSATGATGSQTVRGRKPSRGEELPPGRTAAGGTGGGQSRQIKPTRTPQTRPDNKILRKPSGMATVGSNVAAGGLGSGAGRRSKSRGRSWAQRFKGAADPSVSNSAPIQILPATVAPGPPVVKPNLHPTVTPQPTNNNSPGQLVNNAKVVGKPATNF